MIVRIRLLLVAAGACFALAAVVHAGYFEHRPTLLAEVMLDGTASSMDTRPLRPERFAAGEPNGGSTLL